MNDRKNVDGVDPLRRAMLHYLSATMIALPLLPQMLWANNELESSISDLDDEIVKFMSLSATLIPNSNLNREAGLKIMSKLQSEPWGKEHLSRVLQKFSIGESSQASVEDAFASLDQGERWFVGHLLTTWVTGIYFHESGNHVVSYSQALMHVSLRDIYPEPNMCDSDFAYWQKPPSLI